MTHSLDPLLKPKSIAVVGASRKPGSIGWQILDNLLSHNFTGAVYPVNPSAKAIHSIKAYPSVDAIGEPVDLAIIVVPAAVAVEAAKECVEAGVKALVMITAGFKEIGGLGAERERELMAMLDGSGVRLVGPNC
ncbi:MAG: CoA-binding protein, partial [Gemmatimonadota bacterium]|nr:CoA-binding protein [Gemmatimonadota bacterium]